jgi:hypothetical protein
MSPILSKNETELQNKHQWTDTPESHTGMPPCSQSFSNNITYPIPYAWTGLPSITLGGKFEHHLLLSYTSPRNVHTEGYVKWRTELDKDIDLMENDLFLSWCARPKFALYEVD